MKKKLQGIPLKQLKSDLMKRSSFRHAYNDLETEFQIADQMIAARLKRKISQKELAKRAHTGQAAISRLENMNTKPSIAFLKRIARALDTKFNITIQ